MSKESFKTFVKTRPELASYVANGKSSWQKLYETYDLYGEDSDVWDHVLVQKESGSTKANGGTFAEVANMLKNIDLETVQKGVNGLQKAIGLLQDLGTSKQEEVPNNYEERPIYKYYED